MEQIYPDLWQTTLEKRFGTLDTHAYLLERADGSVLFYTTSIPEELRQIAERGGVEYQYLSHSHEVDRSLATTQAALGSKLCCDALVEPHFSGGISADVYFSAPKSEYHAGNIEIIHTPGHTNNNLCFRYESPQGKRYLFCGDTLYQENGSWNTIVMPQDGGSREDLRESLTRLRGVDADVIICSVSIGPTEIAEVAASEWHAVIDRLVADLS